MKHRTILLAFLLAFIGSTMKAETNNESIISKLYKKLSRTTNARDSLRTLYDIFDLSTKNDQNEIGWLIYETAGRAYDETSQADILRNLAVLNHSSDSVIGVLLKLTDQLPNADQRVATKVFIINQRVNKQGRLPNDRTLEKTLIDSLESPRQTYNPNIYLQIGLLYQVIQYMGVDADGVFFNESMNRYDDLINKLPASDYPLKNQFYTTAAIIHSRYQGDAKKAIYYDRKLLEIMNQLQKMYNNKFRRYKNFDRNRFISFRRILSNYSALTPEQVEEVWDSINAIASRNDEVRRSMIYDPQAEAYYNMAKKNYANAIPPLLKISRSEQELSFNLMKYNRMLMEASKATGNQEVYVESLERFVEASQAIDSMRKATLKKEVLLHDSLWSTPIFKTDLSDARLKVAKEDPKFKLPLELLSGLLACLLLIYVIFYVKLRLRK